MKHLFYKELLTNAISTSWGEKVAFTQIGPNSGVIEVDDEENKLLYGELAATCGKYGLRKVTPEELEKIKKKLASRGPRNSPGQQHQGLANLRIQNPLKSVKPNRAPAAVVESKAPPAPLASTDGADAVSAVFEDFKPRTGALPQK